jgi:acyl-coenzyme A thioesterase PaaI-like protein
MSMPGSSGRSWTAGGYAGFTLFPADSSVLTVEFKLNLMAPAQGDRLVAEGFVVKPGRTLVITRGEVYAERGGVRTLVALMQQTLMVMHGKADG